MLCSAAGQTESWQRSQGEIAGEYKLAVSPKPSDQLNAAGGRGKGREENDQPVRPARSGAGSPYQRPRQIALHTSPLSRHSHWPAPPVDRGSVAPHPPDVTNSALMMRHFGSRIVRVESYNEVGTQVLRWQGETGEDVIQRPGAAGW